MVCEQSCSGDSLRIHIPEVGKRFRSMKINGAIQPFEEFFATRRLEDQLPVTRFGKERAFHI